MKAVIKIKIYSFLKSVVYGSGILLVDVTWSILILICNFSFQI